MILGMNYSERKEKGRGRKRRERWGQRKKNRKRESSSVFYSISKDLHTQKYLEVMLLFFKPWVKIIKGCN